MEGSRRVASLVAVGGAIGALAVDVLYLGLIIQQRSTLPGGRVPLVAAWIAAAALVAGWGAFVTRPSLRAWLLGASAAALLVLAVPAAFSVGIPLLICATAIGLSALRGAELLAAPRWWLFLAPLLLIGLSAGALAVGFVLTS